ncbi:hypothetical protein L210DRAFT_3626779 [Boletus edulis BED1]|uniref:DUF6533 domain-containing protein n=1 Tax=Boletus edulis BED1 TaxID=1328754 RepID=A0AAD4C9F6_BOLED|nr:hypothetical protein L210DRAFT_3626779 [Boletus edulis BED1]
MSSDLQSVLALLQLNDYLSLVVATAVIYDYCLTISDEITYVWNRSWTKVSTLFLLIRYVGCLSALTAAFGGSTFIPGPVKVRTTIDVIARWSYVIFWVGADMAMILRVYAMYDRSRALLGVLLVMYIIQVVVFLTTASIYIEPKYSKVSVVQLLDITICSITLSTRIFNIVNATIQCSLSTVLCILVVVKLAKDTLQMYQATRAWQINRYISLLTRDGLVYFVATLFISLVNGIFNSQGSVSVGLGSLLPITFADVLLYTLTPRFVMNIRELYVLDIQGRWDIDSDIDSGFGLSSRAGRGVGVSTTIGMMAFAEEGATSISEHGATDDERAESGDRQVLVV